MIDVGSKKIPIFAAHRKWRVVEPRLVKDLYESGEEILVKCRQPIMMLGTKRVAMAHGWALFQNIIVDESKYEIDKREVFDFFGDFLGATIEPHCNGMEQFFFVEDTLGVEGGNTDRG